MSAIIADNQFVESFKAIDGKKIRGQEKHKEKMDLLLRYVPESLKAEAQKISVIRPLIQFMQEHGIETAKMQELTAHHVRHRFLSKPELIVWELMVYHHNAHVKPKERRVELRNELDRAIKKVQILNLENVLKTTIGQELKLPLEETHVKLMSEPAWLPLPMLIQKLWEKKGKITEQKAVVVAYVRLAAQNEANLEEAVARAEKHGSLEGMLYSFDTKFPGMHDQLKLIRTYRRLFLTEST